MTITCASCRTTFDSASESVCPGCGLAAAVRVQQGAGPVAFRSAVPVPPDLEPAGPEPVFLGSAPAKTGADGEPKAMRPKRTGGRVLVLTAVLVLLAAGGGVGAIVWYKTRPNIIRPDGVGFTAALPPGKLQTETKRRSGPEGEMTGQSFTVDTSDGKFGVDFGPLPNLGTNPDAATVILFIRIAISSELESIGMTISQEGKVDVPGSVSAYQFSGGKNGSTFVTRLIWLKNHLVMLRFESNRIKADAPVVTTFLDSFAVTE